MSAPPRKRKQNQGGGICLDGLAGSRVATRYDKLADYLAFVQLASIRLWLRVNESTS